MKYNLCLFLYISFNILQVNCIVYVFEYAVKNIAGRYFYVYDGHTYSEDVDVIEYLGTKYPHLVGKEIYFNGVGEYTRNNRLVKAREPVVTKLCLPHPKSIVPKPRRVSVRGIQGGEVVVHSSNKKVSFYCNKHTVPSLADLAKCALKRQRVKFGANCERVYNPKDPPNCVEKSSYQIKNQMSCSNMVESFYEALEPYLGMNSFSNTVWKRIWRSELNFACFTFKDYKLLKERMLREINTYRSSHSSRPLAESYGLSKIAQDRANSISVTNVINHGLYDEYEELISVTELLQAPLIVKKWYDESMYYNFRFGISNERCRNFVKLVWKGTTKIGIGVAKSGCKIYIVVLLNPKRKSMSLNALNIKQRKRSSLHRTNTV
ncbi:CAP domain-containing protein [Strongyloides ratti]|uniref:CAP domain-containing protein n=1 Tax=Strongyloides ratti TaxID=34506 RepID=A0A090KXI7_STRRB|nr:CAP domain-containing protein [Strongyloides ratti]CEF62185.1 CAP domain-containing protein [Strongyloides ratti]